MLRSPNSGRTSVNGLMPRAWVTMSLSPTGRGALTAFHGLGEGDAVHLASVLALGAIDLSVAVWDRRLHASVVAAGLAVAPVAIG